MPAVTYYISDIEKKQFQKYAKERGVAAAKLSSMIIRSWVQGQMGDAEDED